MKHLIFFLCIISIFSCTKDAVNNPPAPSTTMYFPNNTDTAWERISPSTLGWNENAIQPLLDYLNKKHTKSFMVLVNGRIAMEEYFNGHSSSASWQWNSAGKTLVAESVGIAQQEGLLNINEKVSAYLGEAWSSEPLEKENLITIRHLLTMTSDLSDSSELVIKPNLTYMADAGTRWSYSNVFQLLMDVVAAASGQDFDTYFTTRIKDKIGMNGTWNHGVIFTIYYSNTRSMARFGLLALNDGKWKSDQVINEPYFTESIHTSQNINPSYGYLWWLNGKSSYMIPGGQTVYPGSMIPNAPSNMFSAMGASDQRIYVVPDKKMVIVRMGDASDPLHPTFGLSGFDTTLWGKINAVIK